jgi:DNA-binding MarR family transcriptional regulator
MTGRDASPPAFNNEARITLELLNAIHDGKASSQRSLARDLGIALGLANAYVKRCITKGYIKVQQIPRNRYAYYLTPQGFTEKTRLTARFLSQSFSLFREARQQYAALLDHCRREGWARVALYGAGSLAEIVQVIASAQGVSVVAIVDPDGAAGSDGSVPTYRDLASVGPVDAVIITDLQDPQRGFDALAAEIPPQRLLAPPLLHIVRTTAHLAAGADA